jgi:excisionase family DNA binding protein
MIILQFDSEQLNIIVQNALRKVLGESQTSSTTTAHEDNLLDVSGAADFLNLSTQTVYQLTSKRTIPHFKKGKKLYFKRSELMQWTEEGRQKSVAEMQQEYEQNRTHTRENRIFSQKRNR